MMVLSKLTYLALTNFGLRFYQENKNKKELPDKVKDLIGFLDKVYLNKYIKVNQKSFRLLEPTIKQGFLEQVNPEITKSLALKYKRNPLEHIQRVVFEITTQCNFNCLHCRNGYIEKATTINIKALKYVADKFILLGIKKYEFIGGEISKYGNGWLDLAKHINRKNNKIVTLYTNGWWLEKENFDAAGKIYGTDIEYLKDLREYGVTHILFSIDGAPEVHNKSRKHVGLFEKIIQSFEKIKSIGLKPRISAVLEGIPDKSTINTLAGIATKIYDLPENIDAESRFRILTFDDTNTFSNLIDIGNNATSEKTGKEIDSITLKDLRCQAFYRPHPGVGIKTNGNLSVCPLLDAGEGYGNVYERDIIDILNNMQNSFVYQVHAEKKIKDYLKYLDQDIFGKHYQHICSIRAVLTILARKLENEKDFSPERIKEINLEIAKYAGFIKE